MLRSSRRYEYAYGGRVLMQVTATSRNALWSESMKGLKYLNISLDVSNWSLSMLTSDLAREWSREIEPGDGRASETWAEAQRSIRYSDTDLQTGRIPLGQEGVSRVAL